MPSSTELARTSLYCRSVGGDFRLLGSALKDHWRVLGDPEGCPFIPLNCRLREGDSLGATPLHHPNVLPPQPIEESDTIGFEREVISPLNRGRDA